MTPPRVFVSYSHDSAEHKKWVLEFATTLRYRGIDVVLDQWDLKPGADLPHFMEIELATCDFILMVCTEKYVKKANAGEGGVGYEKMIATSSLLKKISSEKIIPIVRQSSSSVLPTFLQSKLYINFSNNSEIEYSLDELLRTLLDAPLFEKPEIGGNPFQPMFGASPDRTADGVKLAMTATALAFNNNSSDTLGIGVIMKHSDMHRLKLERYLDQAILEKLLRKSIIDEYKVTLDGYDYLVNHGILDS